MYLPSLNIDLKSSFNIAGISLSVKYLHFFIFAESILNKTSATVLKSDFFRSSKTCPSIIHQRKRMKAKYSFPDNF